MSATTWDTVAARGVDPGRLADVVALATSPRGRALLRRGSSASGTDDRADGPAPSLPGVTESRPTDVERADAAEAAAAWSDLGVRIALPGTEAWPVRLDRLQTPPAFVAVRGRMPAPDRPAVAIVGSRRATGYGIGVAAWLAAATGDLGGVVVSGGARGVDAAAHGASLDTGTVVVLGCGHGVEYPRPHARRGGLFDRVRDGGGCLVNELLPTMAPRPPVVRARNRLVAALADVVVVVEGAARSGSLLTATAAAELGVDVLAVPGDVRAPGSAAPHRLLREGAGVCAEPQDLLDALATSTAHGDGPRNISIGAAAAPPGDELSTLPPGVHDELARRWPRPVHPDDLAQATGRAIGTVLAAITRGVVAGELAEASDGVRLRRSPRYETGGRGRPEQ